MPLVDNCVQETGGSNTALEMSVRYHLRPPNLYADDLCFTDSLRVTVNKQVFAEDIRTDLDSNSTKEEIKRARVANMGYAMMRIGQNIHNQAVYGVTETIPTPTEYIELF